MDVVGGARASEEGYKGEEDKEEDGDGEGAEGEAGEHFSVASDCELNAVVAHI